MLFNGCKSNSNTMKPHIIILNQERDDTPTSKRTQRSINLSHITDSATYVPRDDVRSTAYREMLDENTGKSEDSLQEFVPHPEFRPWYKDRRQVIAYSTCAVVVVVAIIMIVSFFLLGLL